jgi:uncharacterized membrane protein
MLWSVVGWAYARGAHGKNHPAATVFALSLCATMLIAGHTFAVAPRLGGSTWQGGAQLWWMVLSGIANVMGCMCMQKAMARGKPGAVWAIIQSAPVVPLLLAVAVHAERPSAMSWSGVALMSVSVLMMALSPRRLGRTEPSAATPTASRGGIDWALIAMAVIGLQQAAMAQPSHAGVTLRPSVRVLVFYAANTACAGLVCLGARVRIGKTVWVAAALAALAALTGQVLIVRSLDQLAQAGRAGLAYPCAVGSTILSFALWRRAQGERLPRLAWSAMLLIVIGLLCIGVGAQ